MIFVGSSKGSKELLQAKRYSLLNVQPPSPLWHRKKGLVIWASITSYNRFKGYHGHRDRWCATVAVRCTVCQSRITDAGFPFSKSCDILHVPVGYGGRMHYAFEGVKTHRCDFVIDLTKKNLHFFLENWHALSWKFFKLELYEALLHWMFERTDWRDE